MIDVTTRPTSGEAAVVQPLYAALHRYAGWLDRQHTSAAVRADINALAAAVNGNSDAMPLLVALEVSLARLPSSAVRKLLRATAKQLRSAIQLQ
jgi:hypothetical protein